MAGVDQQRLKGIIYDIRGTHGWMGKEIWYGCVLINFKHFMQHLVPAIERIQKNLQQLSFSDSSEYFPSCKNC